MRPFFSIDDVKIAYQSRFHFGWYARGRGSFSPLMQRTFESTLRAVTNRLNFHLLEFEVDSSVIRALISLEPQVAPADVTRYVKGNIATDAQNELGASHLWSRGWFVRSIGDVTNKTVGDYVDSQYDARNSPGGDVARTIEAKYRDEDDPAKLRSSNHGQFEFNVHVVMVTQHRRELLDMEIAKALVEYLRRVCDMKGWVAWNVNVVWNHVHLFLGLSTTDSPGTAALSLLNNSEFFLQKRYGASFAGELDGTFLQPGFYVGTVGSATTAQVKAFLGGGVR